MVRALIAGTAALLLASCAAEAGPVPESFDAANEATPQLTGRVVDQAGILSPGFEDELGRKLVQLEEETLVQLVVVTAKDLQGREIAEYTADLANDWGIGDADRDDGLVLLVAPNERQVRIAVGLGLETVVTDDEAQMIVDKDMLIHFQTGNFEIGIEQGVDSLIREVTPTGLKEAA